MRRAYRNLPAPDGGDGGDGEYEDQITNEGTERTEGERRRLFGFPSAWGVSEISCAGGCSRLTMKTRGRVGAVGNRALSVFQGPVDAVLASTGPAASMREFILRRGIREAILEE